VRPAALCGGKVLPEVLAAQHYLQRETHFSFFFFLFFSPRNPISRERARARAFSLLLPATLSLPPHCRGFRLVFVFQCFSSCCVPSCLTSEALIVFSLTHFSLYISLSLSSSSPSPPPSLSLLHGSSMDGGHFGTGGAGNLFFEVSSIVMLYPKCSEH